MNRIDQLFQTKSNDVLSVFFTAGYPTLHSTAGIIKALAQAGVDMIEIGMPFSDPMADGPVIQKSSDTALKQGMSLRVLFSQLKYIRREVSIPLLMMGYLNPVMQYGVEKFCLDCSETGIDGVILPDLPLDVYRKDTSWINSAQNAGTLHELFSRYNLHNIFLVSPQTGEERVRMIDDISRGFIYLVSSSSTTGAKGGFSPEQVAYFQRIRNMKLNNPGLIGFGISDHGSFSAACGEAQGAIIGSAFVKMLGSASDLDVGIREFVKEIRGI